MSILFCEKCSKDQFKLKEQIFKNGTKHVRAECGGCGKFYQYLPQREPNELEAEIRMLEVRNRKLQAQVKETRSGRLRSVHEIFLGEGD